MGLEVIERHAPRTEHLLAALVKVEGGSAYKVQIAVLLGSVFDVAHEHIRHPEQLQLFLDVAQIVLAVDEVQIFFFHCDALLYIIYSRIRSGDLTQHGEKQRLALGRDKGIYPLMPVDGDIVLYEEQAVAGGLGIG